MHEPLLAIRGLNIDFEVDKTWIPAVRDVYFVSGSYDFLLHVATADAPGSFAPSPSIAPPSV